jgi:hypothetical protein
MSFWKKVWNKAKKKKAISKKDLEEDRYLKKLAKKLNKIKKRK